jgi:hypothetical protein
MRHHRRMVQISIPHVAVASVAAIALVAPISAPAATPKSGTFKAAKVQRGYDLKFTVAKGKVTKLVARVLEDCSGSTTSTVTTVGPKLTWKISKSGKVTGRKKETAGDLTLYTTLEGRFTNSATFTGTIRQESIVAGATCDTYKLKFTAKRK